METSLINFCLIWNINTSFWSVSVKCTEYGYVCNSRVVYVLILFCALKQQVLLPSQCLLQECLFNVNIIFRKQKLYQTGIQQITALYF